MENIKKKALLNQAFNFQKPEFDEMPVTEIAPEQSYQPKDNSSMYLADLAASAGPGLLALLGGASANVVSPMLDKGNAYAMKRGAQEEITKANTSVIDNNGQPLNIRSRDAIGEQPYYQQKVNGLGGKLGGKEFAPVAVKNIRTGEVLPAKVTGNGYMTVDSNEMFGPEWLPFRSETILREKTVQGGSVAKARDQYNGKIKTISGQQGIGDLMGGVSKEEALAGIDAAKKGKDKSFKAVEAIEGARRSLAILDRPNLTPEEASSGIFLIIKAINGERLSDTDYANLRGEEFKSYARQVEDWAGGRIAGQISPKAIAAFKLIAQDMIKAKQREIESIRSNYLPANTLPQSGQVKLETIMGGKKKEESTNWKNSLKGIK